MKQQTVSELIERFIGAMNGTGGRRAVKPLGQSHEYTLRFVARSAIGAKIASELTKKDIIAHCEGRLMMVCPATINGDIGVLRGVLKYAGAAWADCEDVSDACIAAAMPFLLKHNYVGKSTPRTKVPTDEEKASLVAHFKIPPKKKVRSFIHAMPDIIEFSLESTRRISEICRIDRVKDVDLERKDDAGNPAPVYRVRNMKDPKRRNKEKWFPLYPELAEILFRQPVHPTDTRFFPFNAKSVGAKYTLAKKALGIVDLHFHDNRRKGITERLKTMTPHQVRHFFSGHDSVTVLERVYDATDPADGFAVQRQGERRAAA